MERLVDALARVVQTPLRDPLQAEHIAVPSPGMERWLSMELSKRVGVWANPAFPFPRKLLEHVFAATLGETQQGGDAYDPASMLFGLAQLMPGYLAQSEFAQVAHYLANDMHAQRRLPLARRIADLFDQYATYRPDQVLGWMRGKEQGFQAQLFRAFAEQHGPQHVAARASACLAALADRASVDEVRRRLATKLPERVSLFGISTLPPLYVQLLAALGEHIEVHLFLLSPSREYYGDLRSHRENDAARRRHGDSHEVDPQSAAFEPGHPLLASLGKHGRELQVVLEETGSYQEISGDLYQEPGDDTLLHLLQSDLLSLLDRSAQPRASLKILHPADASVSIHACHGAMREVEVLHDQLLALLADPEIEPHDVIVMTPDIEAYAPMIEAVFSEASGRPPIAFRIADRGALRTHAVVSALDAILEVLAGRMAASCVLDLLGVEVIRARFAIAADDVETLRELVAQSGVRWGVDAAHRAQVGQPEREENTWRFGLERLVLGYTMPASDDTLFLGRAPATLDVGDAELLGRLLDFCDKLFALREELSSPCSIEAWEERLRHVLSMLILNDASTAHEHKLCLRALATLTASAKLGGFEEAVELSSVRTELARTLDASAPAQGFLSGGVTFCQLVPMRSIPFKAVCMLGLNDGVFPANDTPLSFDLIAQKSRPGDRSRRNDDRQLFLEALLSARERLLITYVGQSIHDGKPLPPSVLVSELIEHALRSCQLPDELDAAVDTKPLAERFEARLVVRHPLKAWSPRYFGASSDARLFSYASGQCEGARALLEETKRAPAFFAQLRAAAQPAPRELGLLELEAWLVHPVRAFIRQRMDIPLGGDRLQLEDREPMTLDALDRWQLGTELLMRERKRGQVGAAHAMLSARGQLPLGTVGKLEYDKLLETTSALYEAFEAQTQGEKLPSFPLDMEVAGVHLVGELSELWSGGHVRLSYSRVGGRRELRHFLRHVVLASAAERHPGAGLPTRSVLVGRAPTKGGTAVIEWGALQRPWQLLQQLVELYLQGQEAPVPLLEHASRAYAQALHQGKTAQDALYQARRAFGPSSRDNEKDAADAYVSAAYTSFDEVLLQREPIDFATVSERVYAPLLAARRTL